MKNLMLVLLLSTLASFSSYAQFPHGVHFDNMTSCDLSLEVFEYSPSNNCQIVAVYSLSLPAGSIVYVQAGTVGNELNFATFDLVDSFCEENVELARANTNSCLNCPQSGSSYVQQEVFCDSPCDGEVFEYLWLTGATCYADEVYITQ